MNYTKRQIADWRAFEKVRRSGKFNMFHKHAHDAAGLRLDEVLFTMQHFAGLRDAAKKTCRTCGELTDIEDGQCDACAFQLDSGARQ